MTSHRNSFEYNNSLVVTVVRVFESRAFDFQMWVICYRGLRGDGRWGLLYI